MITVQRKDYNGLYAVNIKFNHELYWLWVPVLWTMKNCYMYKFCLCKPSLALRQIDIWIVGLLNTMFFAYKEAILWPRTVWVSESAVYESWLLKYLFALHFCPHRFFVPVVEVSRIPPRDIVIGGYEIPKGVKSSTFEKKFTKFISLVDSCWYKQQHFTEKWRIFRESWDIWSWPMESWEFKVTSSLHCSSIQLWT